MAGYSAEQSLSEQLVPLCERPLAAARAAVLRNDSESLHDYRVALRRLKVIVANHARADRHRRKVMRELASMMEASSGGRDAEVMLAWLQEIWPRLDSAERLGAEQWREVLERRGRKVGLVPERQLAEIARLLPLLDALRPRVKRAHVPLGEVTALRLEKGAQQLHLLFAEASDSGLLHALRLQVKRLRYLLLPLVDEAAACRSCAHSLQKWQERLGNWHDALLRQQALTIMLRAELTRVTRRTDRAVAKGQPVTITTLSETLPGLLALARLNSAELRQRERGLRRAVRSNQVASLDAGVQSAIAELRTMGRG